MMTLGRKLLMQMIQQLHKPTRKQFFFEESNKENSETYVFPQSPDRKTERWSNIPREERKCKQCKAGLPDKPLLG